MDIGLCRQLHRDRGKVVIVGGVGGRGGVGGGVRWGEGGQGVNGGNVACETVGIRKKETEGRW